VDAELVAEQVDLLDQLIGVGGAAGQRQYRQAWQPRFLAIDVPEVVGLENDRTLDYVLTRLCISLYF
jgi:hypothetical protein